MSGSLRLPPAAAAAGRRSRSRSRSPAAAAAAVAVGCAAAAVLRRCWSPLVLAGCPGRGPGRGPAGCRSWSAGPASRSCLAVLVLLALRCPVAGRGAVLVAVCWSRSLAGRSWSRRSWPARPAGCSACSRLRPARRALVLLPVLLGAAAASRGVGGPATGASRRRSRTLAPRRGARRWLGGVASAAGWPLGWPPDLAAALGGLDGVDELRLLHASRRPDAQAAGHRLQVGEQHGVEPTSALLRPPSRRSGAAVVDSMVSVT